MQKCQKNNVAISLDSSLNDSWQLEWVWGGRGDPSTSRRDIANDCIKLSTSSDKLARLTIREWGDGNAIKTSSEQPYWYKMLMSNISLFSKQDKSYWWQILSVGDNFPGERARYQQLSQLLPQVCCLSISNTSVAFLFRSSWFSTPIHTLQENPQVVTSNTNVAKVFF